MSQWRWYWFVFRRRLLPVTVHLDGKDMTYGWERIHGLQLGSWFFGVIKGAPALHEDINAR